MERQHRNFGSRSGISNREWWRQVVVRSFAAAGVSEERLTRADLPHRLYDSFGGIGSVKNEVIRHWEFYSETRDVLRLLYEMPHIRMGVISNWDERLDQCLKALGVRKEFDFVIASGVLGIEKPDPRVFHRALSYAGVPPARALHVGDNYKKDYLGAKNVGMEALYLNRSTDTEPPSDIPAADVARDLYAVIERVEAMQSALRKGYLGPQQ